MVFLWSNEKTTVVFTTAVLDFGGPEGDRTLDLGIANAAFSQLNYGPKLRKTASFELKSYEIVVLMFLTFPKYRTQNRAMVLQWEMPVMCIYGDANRTLSQLS